MLDDKEKNLPNENIVKANKDNALNELIEALYLEFGRANQMIHDIHKSFFPVNKQSLSKDLEKLKEAVPEQSMIDKEFANLREVINNKFKLHETLQAKQEENDLLQEKNDHIKSLLDFRDNENNNLRQEIKKKDKDIEYLMSVLDDLNNRTRKFFKSKRWKVVHILVELQRKILMRPKKRMNKDKIQEVYRNYNTWKENRE